MMIIISKLPFLFRTSVILTVELAQLHDGHNLQPTLPPHRSFSSCLCSFSKPRMNISLSCAATIQIRSLLCSDAQTCWFASTNFFRDDFDPKYVVVDQACTSSDHNFLVNYDQIYPIFPIQRIPL